MLQTYNFYYWVFMVLCFYSIFQQVLTENKDNSKDYGTKAIIYLVMAFISQVTIDILTAISNLN